MKENVCCVWKDYTTYTKPYSKLIVLKKKLEIKMFAKATMPF